MDYSYLIIFLIIGFVVWFQFGTLYAVNKLQGKDVSHVLLKFNLPVRNKLMLFFSSERCGPCRAMYPVIDKLKLDYSQVITIDVGKESELAERMEIRATPTTVIINNGLIEKILLGSQSETKLRTFLKK